MALINKAIKEITVKLVYYGPGLCGKTTNLEQLFKNPRIENKGKMISMTTETDRTLFFDFLPMELGQVGGNKVRVGLYTVPGQVFYDATRRLVLRGTDGVIFVADSQRSMIESNIESLKNLRNNLIINSLDPDKIPIVLQYNKRDAPTAMSVEEMENLLNPQGLAHVEAIAIQGEGVMPTFQRAVTLMLENLRKGVDVRLVTTPAAEAKPAAAAAAPAAETPAAAAPPTAPAAPAGTQEPSPFDESPQAVAAASQPAAEMLADKDKVLQAIYRHNENTIGLLAAMIDDLRQQQEVLQKLIGQ